MARLGWLVLGMVVACATPGMAKPVAPRFVPTGTIAEIPRGFAELCAAEPTVCGVMAGHAPALAQDATLGRISSGSIPADTAQDAGIAAPGLDGDRARMRLLKHVDGMINAHVRQQSDRLLYGVGELWRPSGSGRNAAGDCEDLAIQKRLDLIAAGFPPARLFFGIVYRSDIGLHTVLLARLDAGDVVLDSRSNFIEPWSDTRYEWLVSEQPGNPSRWYAAAA